MKNLIYSGQSDLTTDYWLASPCVNADFDYGCAEFRVRYINNSYVDAAGVFYSRVDFDYNAKAVRPVVSLNANVQLKYENSSWVIY